MRATGDEAVKPPPFGAAHTYIREYPHLKSQTDTQQFWLSIIKAGSYVKERARTGLCNSSLLFQEMFAGYRVLDAVLGLLHLINSLQLEKLNQQIKTSGDTVGQTVLLETETELFGGNEVVSSPSENVSAVAEEGTFCTPDGDRGGEGGGMPIVLFTSLRLHFARFFFPPPRKHPYSMLYNIIRGRTEYCICK